MDLDRLKKLISMDDCGMLDVRHTSRVQTRDEKLIATFEEINIFIDKHGCEPSSDGDVAEFTLHSRLLGIRRNAQKIIQLKPYDRHNLLKIPQESTLANMIESDPFGLLSVESDIFTLKHVPGPKQREEEPDFIAKRKPCRSFEKYEPLFKQCQQDLKNGKRQLEKFNEKQRVEGQFFVLNGMLLLLDKIYNLERGSDGKLDGRTRLIFDNGTMSNMLFRSLTKRLFENGQHVSDDKFNYALEGEIFSNPTEEDKAAGYIYVLSSKSKDSSVKSIKNLFKIGYSETSVEDRIKNASSETTYLMAPVRIVSTFKAYNMNPQKFEALLHRFFDSCRINIDVYDNNGTRHVVREWFQIPYEDIETAIELIISGDVVKYAYSKDKGIYRF